MSRWSALAHGHFINALPEEDKSRASHAASLALIGGWADHLIDFDGRIKLVEKIFTADRRRA